MLLTLSVHFILAFLYSKVNADDLVSEIPATLNTNEVFLIDDTLHTWSSPQFPNAYPPQNQILIVKCDPGYSVSFTIESLDLDGDRGDILVIKPGTTLEDDSEGKVFTYKLKSKKTYLVHSNNVFLSLQVVGNNEAGKTGFSLLYKRVGEAETSTTPTPPTLGPTPMENESIDLIVHVSGKSEAEFTTTKVQMDFKNAVSQMTMEYCNLNNILLTKEITEDQVHINYITQCPFSWPERENCMKIQFSVSIFVAGNSSSSGYQLKTSNLEPLWYTLGNKHLEQYGMSIYTEPGNRSSLNWWIILPCITIVLFSVLLYAMKVFGGSIPKYGFKNAKPKGNNMLPSYIRSSVLSMSPHPYLQSTPPIFDHDAYFYKQFEPDVSVLKRNKPEHKEKDNEFFEDSDDDIIFSNFDKRPKKTGNKSEESYS